MLMPGTCQKLIITKHFMTYVGIWLGCYMHVFDIWTYVTTANQCLKICFPSIICYKTSIGSSQKKHKTIKNIEKTKTPKVNPHLHQTIIYT